MAFRRLAIIDLSPDGNQPMTNEDNNIAIVYNGEIYNYRDLRAQLEDRHQFRSRTDTEVLIHGYEEWGLEGLLQRIDGMFAFAIWDERRRELLLARDRIGKKPLYYAPVREGLAFASTLNGLRELLPQKPELDRMALDEYLVYQAVPAPRTIYAGVSMLPPAHFARLREGQALEIGRYWDISYARKQHRKQDDLLAELDHLIRGAVERRLMSDVPLGAFLSGGVDSSLIVGMMSDLGAGPVEAVTIGFDDPDFDERPHARQVAERWKANLHEVVLSPDEAMNLPEIVWHYGQPLADVSIVPTFAVARAAREHVTVVLNGDGGDEAFGGYARPVVARAAQMVRSLLPEPLHGAGAWLARGAGRRGQMLADAVGGDARERFTYKRGLGLLRSALYTPEFLRQLGDSDPNRLHEAVWKRADGPTDADRVLYEDLTTYLPNQLLVKMDVSTMAHSVEARSPLLDTRLLEFAATIPTAQLIQGFQTKRVLKKLAERYAPRDLLYRRKRGFVMPASQWLRGELAPILRGLLTGRAAMERGLFRPEQVCRMLDEHLSGQQNWGDVLWTLMVLEIWFRLFVDQTLTRKDRLDSIP